MATNKDIYPIFTRVSADNLRSVPVQDGRIILIKDDDEIFYDVGTTRHRVTQFIDRIDINVPDTVGRPGKLYYDEHTNSLYIWDKDYKKFIKIVSMTASEIAFNSIETTLTAKDVQSAIVELKTILDRKVDVVSAKDGTEKVVVSNTSAVVVGDEGTGKGKGVHFSKTTMALKDGSLDTTGQTIRIKDLGAATEDELATLNAELSEKIAQKLDTANIKANIVTDVEFNPTNDGFEYVITCLDLRTGNFVDAINGTITADDMMVATKDDAAKLQSQINFLKGKAPLMFAIDFGKIFNTDEPPQDVVYDYLTQTLHHTPTVGTSIINTDSTQKTYNYVYTFYVDETIEPTIDEETGEKIYALKLVPDGPDKINIATSDTIGGIRVSENGDINVDMDGTVTVKNKSITIDKLADTVVETIDNKIDKSLGDVVTRIDISIEPTGDGKDDYPEIKVMYYITNTETGLASTVELATPLSFDVLADKFDAKADKVANAVEGNITVFDTEGNIKDSGTSIDDIATKIEGAVEDNIATFADDGTIVDSGKSIDDIKPKWIDWDEKLAAGDTSLD